jgi:hypothetical protein
MAFKKSHFLSKLNLSFLHITPSSLLLGEGLLSPQEAWFL